MMLRLCATVLLLGVLATLPAGEPGPARIDCYGDPLPEGAIARLGTARLRHNGAVCVVYSPDGKMLASGGSDGTLRLWDAATGKGSRRFAGHTGAITSVAFSSDGKRLTSGSRDGTVRVWNIAAGEEMRCVADDDVIVWCVAFSPDGTLLASADSHWQIIVRDAATGEEVQRFRDDAMEPHPVVFSPDGKSLFVIDGPAVAQWNIATGQQVRAFEGHKEGRVGALAISSDGKFLATGGLDNTVRVWDVRSGKELHKLEFSTPGTRAVSFAPDGTALAALGARGTACLWKLPSGVEVRRFPGCGREGHSLVFSPDRKVLACAGDFGVIQLRETATGEDVTPTRGHVGGICALAFAPDGKSVISAGWEGSARLWETRSGRETRRIGQASRGVEAAAFSLDGRFFAGAESGDIRVRDVATGKELHRLDRLSTDFLVFTADGKAVICGDTTCGALEVKRLDGGESTVLHPGPVFRSGFWPSRPGTLAVAPDGRQVVSPLASWDLATGSEQAWPIDFWEENTSFVFSPSSKILAGTRDHTVRLIELASRRTIGSIKGVGTFVVFSPDGRTLATPGPDCTVRLLDVATGQERRRLAGHQAPIQVASFSSDGNLLATGSADTTILIWDLSALRDRRPLRHSPATLRQFWSDLDDANPARAYRAVWSLADAPEQVPTFLRERLGELVVEPARLARLVTDLDADDFEVRDKARAELEHLGDLAEPALRRTLSGNPSAEVRRQVRELLQRLESTAGFDARRRLLRTVEALEMIGTAEARRTLEWVRTELPGTWLKQEATDAILRLTCRQP
jgi:WD40 repeat protein